MTQLADTRIDVLEEELKMDACKFLKEWEYLVLTGYVLASYMDWKCRNVWA